MITILTSKIYIYICVVYIENSNKITIMTNKNRKEIKRKKHNLNGKHKDIVNNKLQITKYNNMITKNTKARARQ